MARTLTDRIRAADSWPAQRAVILEHVRPCEPSHPKGGPGVADSDMGLGTWDEVNLCVAAGIITRDQYLDARDRWKKSRPRS